MTFLERCFTRANRAIRKEKQKRLGGQIASKQIGQRRRLLVGGLRFVYMMSGDQHCEKAE